MSKFNLDILDNKHDTVVDEKDGSHAEIEVSTTDAEEVLKGQVGEMTNDEDKRPKVDTSDANLTDTAKQDLPKVLTPEMVERLKQKAASSSSLPEMDKVMEEVSSTAVPELPPDTKIMSEKAPPTTTDGISEEEKLKQAAQLKEMAEKLAADPSLIKKYQRRKALMIEKGKISKKNKERRRKKGMMAKKSRRINRSRKKK